MEITEVFYPFTRQHLRTWLEQYHQVKSEVWLQRFVKASGQASISYDDIVEECLSYGWIDGILKKLDVHSNVQRITPRKKKTFLSELNRQRIWKLQKAGLMTPAGIAPVADQIGNPDDAFVIPLWIVEHLQSNPLVWEKFNEFPYFYQRLKVSWIQETGPKRQEEMMKRLNYLLKMTEAGKMYGSQPLAGW